VTGAPAGPDCRADGIARTLLDAGAVHQDKVACPQRAGLSMFAAFKAGLVPVNTNYRYADDELVYLWDNADAVAVVFHGTFTERIEGIRSRVPGVKTWLWVDDASGPCPDWATPYEDAAKTTTGVLAPWGRGRRRHPHVVHGRHSRHAQGVMWRQDSLIRAVVGATDTFFRGEVDYDALREKIAGPGITMLPGCPLMHGTGQYTTLLTLCGAGCVETLTSRHFDVEEMLDETVKNKVNMWIIVGDAFAKPILKALDANPGKWDISSVFVVTSSGVMWSQEIKDRLLEYLPGAMLIDAFSSSEAIGLGQSVSTAGSASGTAKFQLGDTARVITDDGRNVEPGSNDRRVAVRGTPHRLLQGPREVGVHLHRRRTYSIPGDYATVEADGTITLLGRGSVCINTGGEKVFPEEVEEVLKLHPGIHDSVVVGLPDDKFGEAITAVVERQAGADDLDEDEVIAHVKAKLASFKAPKSVVVIDHRPLPPTARSTTSA
jgi:fatty-acyl-CoA synthase